MHRLFYDPMIQIRKSWKLSPRPSTATPGLSSRWIARRPIALSVHLGFPWDGNNTSRGPRRQVLGETPDVRAGPHAPTRPRMSKWGPHTPRPPRGPGWLPQRSQQPRPRGLLQPMDLLPQPAPAPGLSVPTAWAVFRVEPGSVPRSLSRHFSSPKISAFPHGNYCPGLVPPG